MSDAELVWLARAGRTEAFAELVGRWAGRVTALCHARVGNAHLADDLAQETLLRGWRALGSLSDPERFGAWLCGIALRACLDWKKARQNAQVPFSVLKAGHGPDDYPAPGEDGTGLLERREQSQQVLAEIEALPAECRQVILLYYYEDVTYRDVAELLGVSTATVNARLTRARAILRSRLSPCVR
jgi:RNA polymerase sigma-70 factor (ECF subfamily)